MFRDDKGASIKQGRIHVELQGLITANRRMVIKFPREHGKTTQIIFRIAWEIGRDPNLRFKIVSSNETIAATRGKAIKEILESSTYQDIFPHIKRGREWSDTSFSVERSLIMPDATVECRGINSMATGERCDSLFLDDPDDEIVVLSQAHRERNISRVNNVWLNLLAPEGKAFLLCTPWHEKDISGSLAGNWPVISHPIRDMQPVWPERWSAEKLREKRKDINSIAWARGYELIPLNIEDAPIKTQWFRYWNTLPPLSNPILAVDLAISDKSTADYTVIGTLGTDANNNIYLESIIRGRYDFPTTLRLIRQAALRCRDRWGTLPQIGIESVAYQRAVAQALREGENVGAVVELKAEKNKVLRASSVVAFIENGRVYLHGMNGSIHPDQQAVYDECASFPVGAHDDCVDMLVYGIGMLASSVPSNIGSAGLSEHEYRPNSRDDGFWTGSSNDGFGAGGAF